MNLIIKYNIQAPQSRLYPPEYSQGSGAASPAPAAAAGQHQHSVIFPTGVVHRVENGWGLTKVAVVLLNGLQW